MGDRKQPTPVPAGAVKPPPPPAPPLRRMRPDLGRIREHDLAPGSEHEDYWALAGTLLSRAKAGTLDQYELCSTLAGAWLGGSNEAMKAVHLHVRMARLEECMKWKQPPERAATGAPLAASSASQAVLAY